MLCHRKSLTIYKVIRLQFPTGGTDYKEGNVPILEIQGASIKSLKPNIQNAWNQTVTNGDVMNVELLKLSLKPHISIYLHIFFSTVEIDMRKMNDKISVTRFIFQKDTIRLVFLLMELYLFRRERYKNASVSYHYVTLKIWICWNIKFLN